MKLPNACEKCEPYSGAWADAGNNRLKRCDCARGIALTEAGKPKVYREPIISPAHATMCAEMMSAIPFYPGEAGARSAVAIEISAMCETPEQAAWLAMKMIRLYRRWPGIPEMRLVFCNSEQPLDGIDAVGESEVYPGGIPSDRPRANELPAAPQRQIASGEPVSASPTIAATVADLVKATNLNGTLGRIGARRVREIPERQIPEGERITAADVAAEVEKLRNARAVAEVEA